MAKKDEVGNETTAVVLKKRGRKSKKDIEFAASSQNSLKSLVSDNINVIIEETQNPDTNNLNSLLISDEIMNCSENNIVSENLNFFLKDNIQNEESKPVGKKRGRKPKGGKIIQQPILLNNNKESKPNVILHLKCSLKDLETNFSTNNIQGYNFNNTNDLSYDIINIESTIFNQSCQNDEQITKIKNNEDEIETDDDASIKEGDIREVWRKLKVLEHNLHINNICDKKSACFWCTYEFDNPPVYIPKHYIKDSYHVYGCFCSPECATAYLMEECIDNSSKFERYHLINHIYTKIYDYKKNIKPAPNPYYMLEKYYGNLSIQEYRSLLRNERLFLIVDKPLTRILPELHEDNDDFIINNKIIPSNAYQIKKKLQKKQTKTNILSEKFGLS